jgi:hypothetical protein
LQVFISRVASRDCRGRASLLRDRRWTEASGGELHHNQNSALAGGALPRLQQSLLARGVIVRQSTLIGWLE